MSRKVDSPLSQADLETFLGQTADFTFEMAALRALRSAEFECEHAATYTDPVTNRLRAYDIRARWFRPARSIRLAVECKNLRASSPLVVHATPRLASEAYHTLIARERVGGMVSQHGHRRDGDNTFYEVDVPVGRQTDQPIRDDRGDFRSADSATYEKWLQAVNGCYDLLREVSGMPIPRDEMQAHAIAPILVVPEGTLWQVDYDNGGKVSTPVRQLDRTTLILRHSWTVQTGYSPLSLDISHLDVVTLPALKQHLRNLLSGGGLLAGADALLQSLR